MNGGSNSGQRVSQSVPNGSYGPYDHITSIGNACGAKLKAHARKYSRICSPGANGHYMRQWGEKVVSTLLRGRVVNV